MKASKLVIACAGALLLACSFHAAAVRIDLNPTTTLTNTGSVFSLAVVISGLNGPNPALALSDYDLDISYDSSLISASGVIFGAGLGSPPDIFGSVLSTAGVVDLFAVSFADYATLLALQGDSFTLATINFLALAPGTSSLAFVSNADFIVDLINADNQDLVNGADPQTCGQRACIDQGGARVVIGEATVPEPTPLLLLGVALLAFAASRRTPMRSK